jgi:hypothetical protein
MVDSGDESSPKSGTLALTRRDLLRMGGQALLLAPLAGAAAHVPELSAFSLAHPPAPQHLSDDKLLDEIERASFRYFWEETNPDTGQVKDRAWANAGDSKTIASMAATGFGLTALCIADARGYMPSRKIKERVRKTLRFLADRTPNVHGFYYHFTDMNTGERSRLCELSTIDTAILFCGVLTARAHFHDHEIRDLATKLYERVEWPWFLNEENTLTMSWKPETGFKKSRWDHYCELMMLYLLGIGSPTHPLPAGTWKAWKREWFEYQGLRYVSRGAPLFTHQYSHAWFDFRGVRDDYANYYDNSVTATRAHKLFCLSLRDQFPKYSEHLWGISASDTEKGYKAWGGPPAKGPIDGSVVPCAAGGSLPFLKDECLDVLRTLREQHGDVVWKKYGFVDAFNPNTGWVDPWVLGLDAGITLLMAENARTGFVWKTFMSNPEPRAAMKAAGFHPDSNSTGQKEKSI